MPYLREHRQPDPIETPFEANPGNLGWQKLADRTGDP